MRTVQSIEWKHDGALDDEGRIRLNDALIYLGGEIVGASIDRCGGTKEYAHCLTVAFPTVGARLIFTEMVRARGGDCGGPWDVLNPARPYRVVVDVPHSVLSCDPGVLAA